MDWVVDGSVIPRLGEHKQISAGYVMAGGLCLEEAFETASMVVDSGMD